MRVCACVCVCVCELSSCQKLQCSNWKCWIKGIVVLTARIETFFSSFVKTKIWNSLNFLLFLKNFVLYFQKRFENFSPQDQESWEVLDKRTGCASSACILSSGFCSEPEEGSDSASPHFHQLSATPGACESSRRRAAASVSCRHTCVWFVSSLFLRTQPLNPQTPLARASLLALCCFGPKIQLFWLNLLNWISSCKDLFIFSIQLTLRLKFLHLSWLVRVVKTEETHRWQELHGKWLLQSLNALPSVTVLHLSDLFTEPTDSAGVIFWIAVYEEEFFFSGNTRGGHLEKIALALIVVLIHQSKSSWLSQRITSNNEVQVSRKHATKITDF